jgi:pentatricopeptide repeat protein
MLFPRSIACSKCPILHPSIIQFTKILTSLVKTKHYTTVISLYRQMEFKGITPDLITLNILSDS